MSYDKAYILTHDTNNATVYLKDGARSDRAHGSVQFVGNEGSNVTVTMTGEMDERTGIANSVVTVSMVWGEF